MLLICLTQQVVADRRVEMAERIAERNRAAFDGSERERRMRRRDMRKDELWTVRLTTCELYQHLQIGLYPIAHLVFCELRIDSLQQVSEYRPSESVISMRSAWPVVMNSSTARMSSCVNPPLMEVSR